MALGDLLDQIRGYYVQRFIAVLEEFELAENESLLHEVALFDEAGELATEGRLELPMRIDAYVVRPEESSSSIKIETEGMLSFEPVDFVWPETEMPVRLEPFQWNWLDVRLEIPDRHVDFASLRAWFLRWFKSEDPTVGELLGGMHWMSDPEVVGQDWEFSLDLGTAPVAAFEELLDTCGGLGARMATLGQFAVSDQSP